MNKPPLKDPCKYSFRDLVEACQVEMDLSYLYEMKQSDRNNVVKELCVIAQWHWEDIEKNGTVYTAFSPYRD